jgi:hypothetical protein
MATPPASPEGESKKPKPLLDRVDAFLKVSKSIYALIAALAAIVLASKSDARHTRFTIYLVSRMWIEVTLIACCWCVFLMLRYAIRLERFRGISIRPVHFLDLRVLAAALVILFLLLSFVPPMYYLAQSRYHFWSTQVLRSYVEGVKKKVDEQAGEGELNTALNTLTSASDVLKGTAQQDRLEGRRIKLTAAVDRSTELDQSTTNSWNFVTERSKLFALVEAVRVNPENSSAADRLQDKLKVLRDFLASDAQTICSLKELPADFSGRAVALIEARSLWSRYGSGDQCLQHVQAELNDGWGLGPIACNLKRNREVRQGAALESDIASCPPGVDFWTPLSASNEGPPDNATADSEESSPSYPTIFGFLRRWRARQRAKAEYEELVNQRAKIAAQTFDVRLESLPKGSIGIAQLEGRDNAVWSNSFVTLSIPDANVHYQFKLADPYEPQILHIRGGGHRYRIHAEIQFNDRQQPLTGDCDGQFEVTDGSSLHWAISLSTDRGIEFCWVNKRTE